MSWFLAWCAVAVVLTIVGRWANTSANACIKQSQAPAPLHPELVRIAERIKRSQAPTQLHPEVEHAATQPWGVKPNAAVAQVVQRWWPAQLDGWVERGPIVLPRGRLWEAQRNGSTVFGVGFGASLEHVGAVPGARGGELLLAPDGRHVVRGLSPAGGVLPPDLRVKWTRPLVITQEPVRGGTAALCSLGWITPANRLHALWGRPIEGYFKALPSPGWKEELGARNAAWKALDRHERWVSREQRQYLVLRNQLAWQARAEALALARAQIGVPGPRSWEPPKRPIYRHLGGGGGARGDEYSADMTDPSKLTWVDEAWAQEQAAEAARLEQAAEAITREDRPYKERQQVERWVRCIEEPRLGVRQPNPPVGSSSQTQKLNPLARISSQARQSNALVEEPCGEQQPNPPGGKPRSGRRHKSRSD